MPSAVARILALAGKELAELRATPGVLAGPLAMLATAVALPFAVAIGVPWWSGEPLSEASDLAEMARETLTGVTSLGDEALAQAYLMSLFLPMLVLVPVIGAMTLVTTSIVDEMQRRSLEPLLATPLTTLELLIAKAGGAMAVALALLALATLLVGVGAVALAEPGVAAALVDARSIALVTGLAPAAAAVTLMLGVVVSSRARDARSAQQFSVLIVVPLVVMFVGELGGGRGVSTSAILWSTAAGWLLAGALTIVGVRVFDRERILTRWTQ